MKHQAIASVLALSKWLIINTLAWVGLFALPSLGNSAVLWGITSALQLLCAGLAAASISQLAEWLLSWNARLPIRFFATVPGAALAIATTTPLVIPLAIMSAQGQPRRDLLIVLCFGVARTVQRIDTNGRVAIAALSAQFAESSISLGASESEFIKRHPPNFEKIDREFQIILAVGTIFSLSLLLELLMPSSQSSELAIAIAETLMGAKFNARTAYALTVLALLIAGLTIILKRRTKLRRSSLRLTSRT